jgi:hypothetical protein
MVYYQLVQAKTDVNPTQYLKLYINKHSPPWVSPACKLIQERPVDETTPQDIKDWLSKTSHRASWHFPGCACGCQCT